MKDFAVYIEGLEVERIKARNLQSAEKKADKKWGAWTRNGGSPSFIHRNTPRIKTNKVLTVLEYNKNQGTPATPKHQPTRARETDSSFI